MQLSLAVKKILYAADAQGSALDEAQEYLSEAINAVEDEEEETEAKTEAWWLVFQLDPGWYARDLYQILVKQSLMPSSVMTKTGNPSPCHRGHDTKMT